MTQSNQLENQSGVYVMKIEISASAIALMIAFTVPAIAQDAKSIADTINAKWVQAYNNGNAAALTALYTKDAVLIRGTTAEPVVGTDNIRKYYDGEVAHRLQGITIKQTETRALGPDTILDAGVWGGDLPDAKGGKPLHLTGTYITTFVHQGSDWLAQTDAGSMLAPQQ
jgi:uncharacterized protein (TIGR02246 family)